MKGERICSKHHYRRAPDAGRAGGGCSALLLAVVGSRCFSVKPDGRARKSALRECLPGANCGGCGFAGCDAYAEAVASGERPGGQVPGGRSRRGGAEDGRHHGRGRSTAVEPLVATVSVPRQSGQLPTSGFEVYLRGPAVLQPQPPQLAAFGDKDCRFSCLGLRRLRGEVSLRARSQVGSDRPGGASTASLCTRAAASAWRPARAA